jgi:hypothetical protein
VNFTDIKNKYTTEFNDNKAKEDKLKKRKDELKAQIKRIETRIDRIWEKSPFWIDCIVKPYVEYLSKETGAVSHKIYGPFGIWSQVPVYLKYSNGSQIAFRFIPTDLEKGIYELGDPTADSNDCRLRIPIPEDADIAWFLEHAYVDTSEMGKGSIEGEDD